MRALPQFTSRRRANLLLICGVFAPSLLACGCRDRERARIEGKVRQSPIISDSYVTDSPHLFPEYPGVPGATITILSNRSDTGVVIASTRTKDDGSFLLEFPRDLPDEAVIRFSAPGHGPLVDRLGGTQPGYRILGAVLKQEPRN